MNDNTPPLFRDIDRIWQVGLSHFTHGISPAGLGNVFYSWSAHLMQSPGKVLEILTYPAMHMHDFTHRMTCTRQDDCAIDPRFKSKSWESLPWRFYAESFLANEKWLQESARRVPGMDNHEEQVAGFIVRQIMDALCPANFPATNPELFQQTLSSGGVNLVQGAANALHDLQSILSGKPASSDGLFRVGENLATTPGEIVFRNNLMELIRYAPQTETVYKEPVLIIPAWIMKYYILDLSPHNSLVRWLVEQGHTVFIISWKNPDSTDSHLGMDDYYRSGTMAAIDYVSQLNEKIHLVGYCLGGTLAMITAAAMSRDKDKRLRSLTLFAAQGDFSEAGELSMFVTHSEVSFLKSMMKTRGYLDTKQMAGAFQMLRSYDLIWSKIVSDYFEGQRRSGIDLMVWNEDATRMPYKMHSEYLEKLFLHDDFAEGRFKIENKPVAAENIKVPVFCVGTEKDHVAPWRSVHKIHIMTSANITFALTNGGHNAGIVSEPGHKDRFYHIRERKNGDAYLDPDHWLEAAERKDGSWWPTWQNWLEKHSGKEKIPPPPIGKSLVPAPGTYIYQK